MMKGIIHTFSSIERLADFFAARISESISGLDANRSFYMALSGGTTPKAIFKSIAENYIDKIDWSRVMLFWGDERCVSPSSDESNYKMAYENLIKFINIPESNIHRIEGEKDPAHEAERYSYMVKSMLPLKNDSPQFDLVMLGLGDDGHTASVFPDNIQLFNSGQLFEVSEHPDTGQIRITATGKIINNAKEVCFLVTGAGKAQRVAQVLQQKPGWLELPASLVNPASGKLLWLLDDPAAQMLNFRASRHRF